MEQYAGTPSKIVTSIASKLLQLMTIMSGSSNTGVWTEDLLAALIETLIKESPLGSFRCTKAFRGGQCCQQEKRQE
jgi:hypothetical protein